MSLQGQTWWLVGASEGLGRALAALMTAQGAHVIVSARDSVRLSDLAQSLPNARAVPMDVTDTDSVRTAADVVGPVDGLVYLAGAYWPMRAQDYDGDKVVTMLDVNLLGAARVLDGVLPQMVARGQGHIVLTGSLAGFRGLPGAVGYGASKAGLMHLAESLHADLRGSGVRVQQINPGFIRTRLTEKNDFSMPFILSAEEAAARMLAIMQSGRFAGSFPTLFSYVFRIGRFLPGWLYDRLFARTR
ncbi:SDR family NAD(P)-dependent oxidoreductase [Pararhodobacter sp.]|uniref:SDR family NAD(P)-dependent oxidoreductase n=1 Tax=Pararhodobacter sp. TaxID=2127056 RepID=UPI002AFE16CB|nr:SDR family NAD(P)-dependent oxidoreductase [Pararhodobacter sp.]